MRTLQGGVGIFMVVFGFWLCPPNQDPHVAAMPGYLQALAFFGEVFLIGGGPIVFLRSLSLEHLKTNGH